MNERLLHGRGKEFQEQIKLWKQMVFMNVGTPLETLQNLKFQFKDASLCEKQVVARAHQAVYPE
ncbi:hypothetical protein VCV18_012235 [Metarhizium anisopliae]